MKIPNSLFRFARQASKAMLMAAFSQFLVLPTVAQDASPLLEFSTGLVGKQVRLSWVAEPGARYRIEKSSDLSTGGWQEVALVEAATALATWTDPEKTTVKFFYRITRPQPEVFSLEPPVISSAGGEILVRGQLIPPGSFLVFKIDGQTFSFPLQPVAGQPGVWQSVIGAGAISAITGGAVAGRIVDSNGITVSLVSQTIEITADGFASDGPPGLPPGAPMADGVKPVPSIGVVIKKNPGSTSTDRMVGDPDNGSNGSGEESSPIAAWFSKKGYDHYKAHSDMAAAHLQNNPYFKSNAHAGDMVPMNRMAINTKGGMGANDRCSSGVIGEVTLQVCPLSLDCPAGPQISCDLTYRSMVPSGLSSSFGPGWTCAYDLSVTRIDAAHVRVSDGGGRADIYALQPDGSFTCDGMFRSGNFVGETFTLTFADQGKWIFHPLDDSLQAGKISSIRDRNNVALTCDYDSDGLLSSVSSAFGQSLAFSRLDGKISRITDHTGRFCDFGYAGGTLAFVSSPQVGGLPSVAGPTTFTYTSGLADPRRNGNLLSCRDGARRLHCAFTYASQTDPVAVDYDCVVTSRCSDSPAVPDATTSYTAVSGGVLVCDCDELGRLTETTCDRQHRSVQVRDYTGFCVAGDPVTPSLNRPTGKLRATDPDFYQSTCSYNAQHCPVVATEPDGLQTRCTYDWDLARGKGLALQRGNLQVCALRAPGGEERTISMTYQPGFGSFEPVFALKTRTKSNSCNERVMSLHDSHSATEKATLGIGMGKATVGIGMGKASLEDWESQSDLTLPGVTDACYDLKVSDGFRTSLTTTLGQKFTKTFDAAGNLTTCRTPISGAGCDMTYNALGQVTSVVTLDGPGSSFTDEIAYDATSHFCSGVTRDPTGLHLTESCARDSLGRTTTVTDARGFDTLFQYNALDLCVSSQSPFTGSSRIATTCSYDAGGLLSRCDVEHRDASGAPSSTNPAYSSVCVRESSTRPLAVSSIAVENRPVDLPSGADPSSVGLENFDICDFTFDACGQLVETRSPAASLAQPVDQVCSYQYDERGYCRSIYQGGLGTAGAVTTECDYTPGGDLSRCATLGASPAESPVETYAYDGFSRPISATDPMGNIETFYYDNQGYVTRSLYGELDDVPGSAGNVLLAKVRNKTGHVSIARREIAPSGVISGPLFHAIKTKGAGGVDRVANNKNPDLMRCSSAFFDLCTEDDIITLDRFDPASAAAPVQEITTCDYSPAGLLLGVSTNGDSLLACSYDSAWRNNACSDATCAISLTLDGCDNVLSSVRTDFSSSGGPVKTFTTTCAYDALGRCIQTSAGGNVSSCDFDSLDRPLNLTDPLGIVTVCDYDGGPPNAPYSVRTRCDVDGHGKLQTLGSSYSRAKFWTLSTHAHRSVTDSHGSTTIFTCDSLGRCVETDFPDGTQETSSFDNLGRMTGHTRRNGSIVAADFDYRNRLVSSTVTPPGAQIPPITTAIHYDGLGNVIRTTQGTSDIVRAFDSCSDILGENQNGHVVSHTYNHRGRTGTTYPDGTRFNESRDTQGRLISCSAVGGPPIVALEYLGSGVSKDTRLNGVVTTFTYRGDGDAALVSPDASFDACVQSAVTSPASVVLSRSGWSRDASQRIVFRQTAFSASPDNFTPLRREFVTYDRLHRLTRMQTLVRTLPGTPLVTESDVSYTLDLEGKRLTAIGNSFPGSYSSSSAIPPGDFQMNQYTIWPGGDLEWEDNGNLTSFARGAAGPQTLTYDALSRLVSVAVSGSTVVSYGYDGESRLVSRTISAAPQTSTFFIYDGKMCIQELGGDGLPDMTFAALGHCISTRNGTNYYPHGGGGAQETSQQKRLFVRFQPDQRLLTVSNGTVFERFDCDDAGKPIFLTSEGIVRAGATSALSDFKWMAPEAIHDRVSGLYFHGDGVYSPDLGQKISSKITVTGSKTKKEYVGHVTLIKQ